MRAQKIGQVITNAEDVHVHFFWPHFLYVFETIFKFFLHMGTGGRPPSFSLFVALPPGEIQSKQW